MKEPKRAYKDLSHFFGVVEDRNDPEELGRVRVRAFGFHTENKSLLPTEDLQWAVIVNNSGPSMSQIGTTPLGLVEGSWVFGVWVDHQERQIPVILGSIPGVPDEKPAQSTEKGFRDPHNNYPKTEFINESDLPRLARKNAELDASLIDKRKAREFLGDIPTAVAPSVPTVQLDKAPEHYERVVWNEPNPRYGANTAATESKYPFNHVRQSEGGHIEEWDDTPGSERLHRYHTSGTFEEIQATGNKTTKIVGDNYNIILRDNNVYIGGDCNVTITGDAKVLVQGDKYEEVDGNYFLTVKKDRIVKIEGNDVKEVSSNEAVHINENKNAFIGNNDFKAVAKDHLRSIGENKFVTVKGDNTRTVSKNETIEIEGDKSTTVTGNLEYTVKLSYSLDTEGSGTINSNGPITITALPLSLNP